jgi:hypothetical protein
MSEPHNDARRGDAQGCGGLVKTCTCARRIERSHGTVGSAQEAMINGKAIVEGSGDRARRGNTGGKRPYTARRIGRCIECGQSAFGGPHEDAKISPKRVSRNKFELQPEKIKIPLDH